MASSIIKNLGTHCEIVPCSITVTLPDGQTTASTTAVDFSSYVPAGRTVSGIVPMNLGNYILPYYLTNGTLATYIYNVNLSQKVINIRNKTVAWENYLFTFLIILTI